MLVCYMDRKKVLKVQSDQQMSDVSFLELEFRKEFAFEANVNLVVTFQRFDPEWNETVDLDEAAVINNKDKLTALVTPILVTPPVTSPDESPLEVGICIDSIAHGSYTIYGICMCLYLRYSVILYRIC